MNNFFEYLYEANSAGSKFESKIASNINKWLKENSLDYKFKAKRFQTVKESLDNRDENYSDIEITNLKTNDKFFIECKEKVKTNIITTQFNINEDFEVVPVKNKKREEIVEDESISMLKDSIEQSEEFQRFIDFLKEETDFIDGSVKPCDFYFNKCDVNEKQLKTLIDSYNKMVKSGEVEADNKPFTIKTIRETTRNMLACGLLWRLYDKSNTWDICHLKDLSFFGQLVKDHYLKNKKVPAKYIQIDDNFFVFDKDDNPFGIEVDQFPVDIQGRFDLKFTPRFGTGSMYITPRSAITQKLSSNQSFLTKPKWPKI